MKIYISRESDLYSLEPKQDQEALECSAPAYQHIVKERPLYLFEDEAIYYDKHAQELRLMAGEVELLPPLVQRSLERFLKTGYKPAPGDAREAHWLYAYICETGPKWRLESISQNAAALIRNARIEASAQEVESCFLIGTGYMPLYGSVYSIVYSRAQREMWITNTICRNLSSARIVSEGSQEYEEAMDFITKYRAILDTERAPLAVHQEGRKRQELGRKISGICREYITLSSKYRSCKYNHAGGALDKEGKTLALVQVSGFVRNQPYGKGRSKYKKIWIDGFVRGQWIKDGVTYVTIKE